MTQAGPAIPVIVSTQPPDGGPALRVVVVSDGRPTQGGPARPVIVVTDGRTTQGNEPIPVVVATGAQASNVMAGPAMPVVVVSGSLGGSPPVNTVLPSVSGATTIGALLTTTDGTWTGSAPIVYTYQWKRNGVNIGGATNNTYTIVNADNGTTLTATVTATNVAGNASATSTGTVISNPPVNTVLPSISGTPDVGQTLTTTDGTWTNSPTSYAYQWKRNGVNIGGATNNTYVLQAADAGTTITSTVTATNAAGSASATSAGQFIGIVTSGLLIEYRFDDGSGTTLTDYVGGFNGTLGTGVADRPDWVAAGLDFIPGNADVVINTTFPDTNVLGAITICVVANLDTGAAFREFICKCLTNAATATPFEFRTSNAATPALAITRANAAVTSTSNGPATTLGAWRMYSVVTPVAIGTNSTFYVGTSSSAGTGANGNPNPATGAGANLRVGRRPDGAVQMDGIIAYILIYSRALSAGEIAQNYAALQTLLTPRGIALP